MNLRVAMFLLVMFAFAADGYAQSLIPFEFTSEDDNKFLKENDSFKCYVATSDALKTVCLNEETHSYKLLNKDNNVIATGSYIIESEKYLQDGKWTTRYANGKIKLTGYFQRNMPIGTWYEYYSGGGLKSVSNYGVFLLDNETTSGLTGSYQEYYANGKLKVNGFYITTVQTYHDTLTVTDPVTAQDVKKIVKRVELIANRTGKWEYYDENGVPDKKDDQ